MPNIPGRFQPAPFQPPRSTPPPAQPSFVDEPQEDVFGFAEVTNFAQAAARPRSRGLSAGPAGGTLNSEGCGPGGNPLLPRISLVGWQMPPEKVAKAMGLGDL